MFAIQLVDVVEVTMSDAWWLTSFAVVRVVDGTDVVDAEVLVWTLVTDDADVEGRACRACWC